MPEAGFLLVSFVDVKIKTITIARCSISTDYHCSSLLNSKYQLFNQITEIFKLHNSHMLIT